MSDESIAQTAPPTKTKSPASKVARLVSLDVFRGGTMMLMTIVNNPGSWSYVYPPLRHAEWDGWTPTDLVFPFFLFIVGVAIAFALGKKFESASPASLYLKILKRAAVMFGLGLILAGFPYFNLETMRVMGVLQRIALCYLIASVVFLHTSWKGQTTLLALLLIIYGLAMTLIAPPDRTTMLVYKDDNIGAYLDRLIFTEAHLYKGTKTFDPEGLLGTLSAAATALFGVLTGTFLRTQKTPLEKTAWLFLAGGALCVIGSGLDWAWAINKNLWTPAYTVFMAGLSLLTLASLYFVIDVQGIKSWTQPFVIFGVNALLLFFASGLLGRTLTLIKVQLDGNPVALQTFLYKTFFASSAGAMNGSLLYPLALIGLWYVVLRFLYKRNWIWKA
jgi:predicted acyltransferase